MEINSNNGGVVNSIKFKSKVSGYSRITYTIE